MPPSPLALDGGPPTLATTDPAVWPGVGARTAVFPPEMLQLQGTPGAADAVGGDWVHRLERRWADASDRSHVVACRSGRVALAVTLSALDLRPGDEVICPADAGAVMGAVRLAGFTPVPVDLHPMHIHLDPKEVEAAITPSTAAVIAVDRHGTTADYRQLTEICGRHGVSLIEDGSRSLGAVFDQQPVGSHGDVSVCSLAGGDVRSSLGTAGLFATDDDELAATVRSLLLVDNDPGLRLELGLGAEPAGEGPNWTCQLSEIDAAVAVSELRRRLGRIGERVRNGRHLRRRLAAIPGIWVPEQVRGANHVFSSLPLVVVPDEVGLAECTAATLRDTVIDCLTAEGLRLARWQSQGPAVSGGPGASSLNAERVDPGPRAEPRPEAMHARGHGDFPVTSGLIETGIVLGPDHCPFDEPSDTAAMDRIAECIEKVFVANVDRLRALTMERGHTTSH